MYLNQKDSLSQEELDKVRNRGKGKPIPITPEEFKQEVLTDLREALRYFIERQKLVAQAMTEMGLDLDEVAEYGAAVWSPKYYSQDGNVISPTDFFAKHAESSDSRIRKWYEVARHASERNLSQKGVWRDSEQNEWEYFLHGGGCQLTNIETGEPIDWDAPNVNSYTPMFFERHLLWQMSYPYRSIKLRYLCSVMLQPVKLLMKEIQGDNFSS